MFNVLKRGLILLAILLPCVFCSAATQGHSKQTQLAAEKPPLLLGTAWYPEQWPEERWEVDLKLMQAAGIHMVRVGEFAWSRMEAKEGQFDFDWLERAISLAAKHNIRVVLGTPTAAPPAWLTQKYPDTLAVWEDGRRATHGNRGHFRPTSTRYLELSRRIAEEMSKRFGHNPNVIGWQIDNEYGPVSYDDETRECFQEYLKAKFKTLDSLNTHWSTEYWSEKYDNWQEIPIPVGYHNPGLMLEWRRFITETIRNYQQNQIQAIRAHADSSKFITHNFMGFYNGFDHYIVSQDLDFASWDDYVGSGHLDALWNGQVHDLTRGFKRKNFWLMETQPGSVNWAGVNNVLDRGEMRRMAWQAIGHGADTVSYWQWRSAPGGQEQYHGNLVGPDGKPRPIYDEVAQIGREFQKVSGALSGTAVAAKSAILFDYDSRWAIDFQRHHKDFDPVNYLHVFYRPLRSQTQDVDIVNPDVDLSQYKLVIAPALNLISDRRAQHLAEYVRAGGHLVLGTRSGMKDEFNALQPERQPGAVLSELLGGDVVDFYALDKSVSVNGQFGSGESTIWAERLEAIDPATEVMARFGQGNGWLDGQPAIITRKVGAGRITYVGGQFDANTMWAFTEWATKASGVTPALGPVPEGVEVCRRVGGGKEVFILINHTKETKSIALPRKLRDVLHDDASPVSALTLGPQEIAVLTDGESMTTSATAIVQPQLFGVVDGKPVSLYVLRNRNGVEARLTNYGATLVSLMVPDRAGKFSDIVLGYDDANGYANGTAYLGATVGRYGNRIGKARFSLNGKTYTLAKNDGENSLHGGVKAFHKALWEAKDVSSIGASTLQFTYVSRDGEEGFPGTLTARVTYTLTLENELRIDYDVTSDQDTVQNLTHHSYFNLNPAGGNVLSHELTLNADSFTPVDKTLIPTGELRNVEGTPFDFRTPVAIGARISANDEQLLRGTGYDHNWVLNGTSGTLRLAARVYEPVTGRIMEVSTTEPGIQFYSGNFLKGEPGKAGHNNSYRSAFCLETQHFPDSPNHPDFPSTTLKAGEHYRTTTIYKFSVK